MTAIALEVHDIVKTFDTDTGKINAVDGEYQINLSSLPPSAWDYRLTFSEGGVSASTSGTLVSFPPTSVGPVDDTGMTYLLWTTPPQEVHAVLRYAQSSDPNPSYASLSTYNGPLATFGPREGVALSALPPGRWG